MQRGEFDKIVGYAARAKYHVDYGYMLQQLVRSNPQGALDFAKKLTSNETGVQLIDSNAALEIFMSVNLLREARSNSIFIGSIERFEENNFCYKYINFIFNTYWMNF